MPARSRPIRKSSRTSGGTSGRVESESSSRPPAFAVARIAGIQAAKRTPELVPLCHPLMITGVDVTAEVTDAGVELTASVRTAERTGVEMEALTAVAVAGLAVVDMIKAVDRAAAITDVRVIAKSGGRSGDWQRDEPR